MDFVFTHDKVCAEICNSRIYWIDSFFLNSARLPRTPILLGLLLLLVRVTHQVFWSRKIPHRVNAASEKQVALQASGIDEVNVATTRAAIQRK